MSVAFLASGSAFAALPYGTLEYVDRVGTVSNTEAIDVWLRFTVDAASVPLVFSNGPLTGIDPADFPTEGLNYSTNVYEPFTQVDGVFFNYSYSCSDTFSGAGCGNAPYQFEFNYGNFGAPRLDAIESIDLQPGQSIEYLMGRFSPTGGASPAGTYSLFVSGIHLSFYGVNGDGQRLVSDGNSLGMTCSPLTPDCAFTRTVTAVPEPQSIFMILAGLGVLFGVMRRRERIG
jgi:hypothetical protein